MLKQMVMLGIFLSLLAIVAASHAEVERGAQPKVDEVVIHVIYDEGKDGLYVRPGETKQTPIEVRVGQIVKWINMDNTKHTATSPLKGDDSGKLFDVTLTGKGTEKSSGKRTFDKAFYDRAINSGAKKDKDNAVTLEYYCKPHNPKNKPNLMSAKIILKP